MQLSSWKYAAAVHLSSMVDSTYCFPPRTSIDKSPGLSQLVSEHAESEHLASHVRPHCRIQIAAISVALSSPKPVSELIGHAVFFPVIAWRLINQQAACVVACTAQEDKKHAEQNTIDKSRLEPGAVGKESGLVLLLLGFSHLDS